MTNEECIKMLKSKLDGNTDTSYEWCECVRLAIKALEQQRWIPVSEPPKKSGKYLVWMIWGDEEPTYSIINFDADYNEFGEWIEHYDINTLGVIDREFRTYIDVFAWCPLPQPYKESDKE